MGHRHLFNKSQMFGDDHDENRDQMHAQPSYMHFARVSTAENGPLVYPAEHMAVDGVQFSSNWNPMPRPNGYSASCHNDEVPHFRSDVPGPSHDPSPHPSVAGSFGIAPQNYSAHLASSSSSGRRTYHGIEGGFGDHAIASGRGSYKRKSPAIPAVYEGGSAGRFYGGGSSSDLSISSDSCLNKPNTNSQYSYWDPVVMVPGYRANAISIGAEGPQRNVRSRSALELESNLARMHLSSNSLPHPYTACHPIDRPNSVDPSSQSSIPLGPWNQVHVSPTHWRAPVSETIGIQREANQFLVRRNTGDASADIGGYHHDFISSRNNAQQNLHGIPSQYARGARNSYSQRSTPTLRASSSNLPVGQFGMSDDSLHFAAENFASRPSRPSPVVPVRNGERNGRSRRTSEIYHSFPVEAAVRDRLASEALLFVDHAALYASRNMFDQHRDMRLDIDNMSYEELLALGERIGNVGTGLSEDAISKCLIVITYCSSDQIQDEGRCVICLEEYGNTDAVGKLKICGHSYHVGCIRKWLSMKNSCPICKTSVMSDDMKGK